MTGSALTMCPRRRWQGWHRPYLLCQLGRNLCFCQKWEVGVSLGRQGHHGGWLFVVFARGSPVVPVSKLSCLHAHRPFPWPVPIPTHSRLVTNGAEG